MYYVLENQKRKDGVVNTTTTGKSTFASALSYYHERYSKMVMNTDFVWVSLMLCDEELNVVEQAKIDTQYEG